MKRKNCLFFLWLISLLSFFVSAQESESLREQNQLFRNALDLFNKKEYTSAQQLFKQIENREITGKESASVAFHNAACSYYLHNNDALQLLTDFVEDFQTANDVNEAYFLIGNEYFNNKKYKQSLEGYEHTNTLRLNNDEISQYFFNKGYCFLMLENEEKAKEHFDQIKAGNNEYAYKARFYSATLDYQNERYAEARTDFETLKDMEDFSQRVNLYLIDIDHKTQNWEQVTLFDDEFLNNVSKKEKIAIVAMKADAYFNRGDYEQAQKYMDMYETKLRGKESRIMQYQYGFILYQQKSYAQSIEKLNKVITENDSLTQSTYQLIGYAQLALDKKKEAQRSFYSGYKMDFQPSITEECMFNYVKLACDLSYDPYRQAFNMIKQYIEEHPDSEQSEEAYLLIVNLSLSTKNYSDAISALAEMKNKSNDILKIEQKIQFLHAVNLMNAQKYQDAINWFQHAISSDADMNLTAKATYWMAESYYRLNMLSVADTEYKKFQKMTAAKDLPFYYQSYYHLAYIQYDQKKYETAITLFDDFVKAPHQSVSILRDALTRLGDCNYILKNYQQAIEQYDQAVAVSDQEGDYAMFQKALCLGALKRYDEKIEQLNSLMKSYPKSPLTREILYESAMTYLISDHTSQALTYFDKVIQKYPMTQFAVKSKLRKGLILYGQDKNQESLLVLKDVVDHHPETSEAHEALKVIENIYLSMNNIDEYLAYTSNVPFADISQAQKDSLAYFSAENVYTQSNYSQALSAFQTYIQQFSNGIFIKNARNYLADCAMNLQQPDVALEQYEILAQTPIESNKAAIEKAAAMQYEKGNYQQALQHYKNYRMLSTQTGDLIEPTIGIMNCYNQLQQWDSLSMISLELLSIPNVPKNKMVEAHQHIATVAVQQKNWALAKREFQVVRLLGNGEAAAKANYYLTEILVQEENWDAAMESAYDLINDFPNEDYWVVSSFILLSDIYVAKENIFQAEQTLNSIIENCDIETLKNRAIEKLNSLKIQYPDQEQETNENE
ncbi:MAG: tetratricopeptide repeat protein [Bacteroidales bacterium]|nr:tetratricopeptide repeat protein [Bacteroidales bacterium]